MKRPGTWFWLALALLLALPFVVDAQTPPASIAVGADLTNGEPFVAILGSVKLLGNDSNGVHSVAKLGVGIEDENGVDREGGLAIMTVYAPLWWKFKIGLSTGEFIIPDEGANEVWDLIGGELMFNNGPLHVGLGGNYIRKDDNLNGSLVWGSIGIHW